MPKETNTSSRIILLFLLIFIALPAPRESYSILFKLYTLGFLFIGIFLLLTAVNKKRILLPNFSIMLPFFLMPVIYSIYGYYRGNENYYVLRELFLFLLPIITFIVVINSSENIKADDLIKLILWTAVVAGAFLLAYEIFGILFQFKSRFQFRFEYVSRNIGFITIAYILYLFKTERIIDLFWPGFFVLVSSLFLSMGRLQWMTVSIFMAMVLLIMAKKMKKLIRTTILTVFLITPILYIVWLSKSEVNVNDSSKIWRQMEAKTVYENIKGKQINLYIGNGLGHSITPFRPIKLYQGESLTEIRRFHNIFLYLVVKMGIFGMMAFLIALILLTKRFYRKWNHKYRKGKYFLLASYLIFIIFVDGSITGHFTMNINTGMELGLFLALMEKIS